jgi:hypothetical protein
MTHRSKRSIWLGKRGRALRLGLPFLVAAATAAHARAAVVDFEGAAPGSDSAALAQPGISIGGGLVLSESLVEFLAALPAVGTWNTTPGGAQGALNTLDAILTFAFDTPVSFLQIDVLSLPDANGDPTSLLLLGTDDGFGVAAAFDAASGPPGDSGLPEGTLSISGTAISYAILCAQDPGRPGSCLDPGEPSTFWIDDVRFEPIPEPATALLVGGMIGALALRRRIS